jgi:hypothetical protein
VETAFTTRTENIDEVRRVEADADGGEERRKRFLKDNLFANNIH